MNEVPHHTCLKHIPLGNPKHSPPVALPEEHQMELFPPPPPPPHTHTFQDDVFAINYISIAFPMKQFSFKFILRVIV